MKKEVKQLEKNSKKETVKETQPKNSQKKNNEIFKEISIKLKIEDEENEMSISSSWKNVSVTDSKSLFSKIDSLIPLFKKFNKKYGEEDVEVIAEADDGKTEVKSKIGDYKMKFILDTIKEREVLLEISKKTGISINKLKNVVEFEEDD